MTMEVAPSPASAAPASQNAAQSRTTDGTKGQSEGQQGKDGNPYKGTKHRTVIDGVEQLVDYDQLISDYQTKQASQKRFQEAASREKAVEEVLHGLKSGDEKAWGWLKKQVPGDVFRKIAFDYAYQQMEYDALDPAKKRELELNEREEKLRQKEESEAQKAQRIQWEADVGRAGEMIQQEFSKFAEKTGRSLSSEEMFRMSEYMLASIKRTGKLPNLDQVYGHVSGLREREALDLIRQRSTNPRELLSWLPPEVAKALKRAVVEEGTSGHPRRHAEAEASDDDTGPAARGESKKMGIDDAFEALERKIKRRRR